MFRNSMKGTFGIVSTLSKRQLLPISRFYGKFSSHITQSKHSSIIFLGGRCYSSSSTSGLKIPKEVINLPIQTYHNKADEFLEDLLVNLEDISDLFPDAIPDVELSQGVMTFAVPSVGTYVINKQPPNKQIWFASPVSGPNRFDLYKNEWISLRDGSKLIDILSNELKTAIPEADVRLLKED